MSDIPIWPAKLTREQQKAVKQRAKDFDAALKSRAPAAGWRFARGSVFRQSGDWFVDMLPSLLWESGAAVRLIAKPMALDPLFWEIVGLSENERLPLSFRSSGAWVLRPRSIDSHIGLGMVDVELLADRVLKWGNEQAGEILKSISVKSMLAALPSEEHLRGQPRALATCLHILAGDLAEANRLCQIDDPHAHPLMREGGGFSTHNRDGSVSTFCDQAREWIDRKRRCEGRPTSQ